MENLVEIRCPLERKSNSNGEIYKCNRICVKVTPGSGGEARCRSCHMSFEFVADDQARATTGVKVKPVTASADSGVHVYSPSPKR